MKEIESVSVCMFGCGGRYRRFDAMVERWIRCIDKTQHIKNSCGNSIGYLVREGTKLDSGESSARGQREKINWKQQGVLEIMWSGKDGAEQRLKNKLTEG